MAPLLLNYYGGPYTGSDAIRFLKMLREGAFNTMGPAGPRDAGKPTTGHGMKPLKPGEQQMSLQQVVAQKLALSTAIKTSFDQHKRKHGTQDALFELGRYVAHKTGAIFVPGPLKSYARVMEKVLDFAIKEENGKQERGYEGNYGKVKDEVRLTLVGDDMNTYAAACDVMRTVCNAGNGLSFIKNTTRDPALDPCGYSDTNMVVKLPNGQPGEVQVNNRAVLYGKMSKKDFCNNLGVPENDYAMLEASYGIEGGLGHALYEIWQKDKGPRGKLAADLAKRYYGTLRSFPRVDGAARTTLVGELSQFSAAKENAIFFAHA